jgi:hypothetical protein
MQSRLKVKTTSPSPWSARLASSLFVFLPPLIHPPVILRRALFARRRTYAPASSATVLAFDAGTRASNRVPHVSPLLRDMGIPFRDQGAGLPFFCRHHHTEAAPVFALFEGRVFRLLAPWALRRRRFVSVV